MTRKKTAIVAGIPLLLCVAGVALYLYMIGNVKCPYCSTYRGADISDLVGKRVMSIRYWDKMTEEERSAFTGNPGVYITEHCPYCSGSGWMRRIDLFMGKRPESEKPLP
jgi:hypothetical protein